MTQREDRDPKAAGRQSGDDAETGGAVEDSDHGSAPVGGDRTGEDQAAINRENEPPA
ncbi:MAG TPA: hypothetical protein VHU17_00645 [Acidimicrobiales bacterium]|nr:hypothetical protein [Acidimicrobiales bacterium]